MSVFDYLGNKDVQLIKDALIIDGVNFGAGVDRNYTFSGEDNWKVLDGAELNYRGC